MKRTLRIYPTGCTSAYCGKTKCPEDCPRLPLLRDFKAWVETTGAKVTDPIWSPTVYEVPTE